MLLCDTGPLVAVLNADDGHHDSCRQLLEEHPGPLLLPAPVISEVCYLAGSRLGAEAEASFLDALGGGDLDVVDVVPRACVRAASLVRRYSDFPLGAVDAFVVAVAERLACTEIATLDRRHFSAVRPSHVSAFTLRPE